MGEFFWGHLRYILQPLEKIGILEMGGVQVGAARSLARELARGRDGSHDAAHSERVARLAVRLAREEQAGGRWGELAGGGARDLEHRLAPAGADVAAADDAPPAGDSR